MKQEMISYLSTRDKEISDLCKYLYDNAEESYKETNSSKYICNLLKEHGFSVENNYLDFPTAFYATKGSGHPKICFICEYDAVKDRGHITAHNGLTTTSYIAAISLGHIINKLSYGTVIVIGCPGEYAGGTKDVMLKQGVFDDIDVVMVSHPDTVTCESGSSSAVIPLSIKFTGHDGLSFLNGDPYTALDAVLLTFNTLNAITKGFCNDITVNSVISEGGDTPLLVPKEAEGKFYIRATNIEYASIIENKIKEIAKFTSKLLDVDVKISLYQFSSDELISNRTLNRLYNHNLKECGIINICPPRDINAAISLGSISKKVPLIHPYISIIDNEKISYGTDEFAKCTISDFAINQYKKSGLALAFTGLDIITNSNLLAEIKSEFFNCKSTFK